MSGTPFTYAMTEDLNYSVISITDTSVSFQ